MQLRDRLLGLIFLGLFFAIGGFTEEVSAQPTTAQVKKKLTN